MYPMFFGPPGAGKGTQAELLSRRLHIPHVSGGGLLRAVAAQGGSSAATIREQLASGEIITDSFVMDLIASRLNQPDCASGAILDGCVRTLEQAEKLDEIMASRGGITHIILLRLPDRVAAARLASRCTSAEGRESTGARQDSPALWTAWARSDDTTAIIPKRQFLYRTITEPIIDYYRARFVIIDIDGDQPIPIVHEQIVQSLSYRASLRPDSGLAENDGKFFLQ
jgi:adenylate kinase